MRVISTHILFSAIFYRVTLIGDFFLNIYIPRFGPFVGEKKGTKTLQRFFSEEKGKWIIWNLDFILFYFLKCGPPITTISRKKTVKRVAFIYWCRLPYCWNYYFIIKFASVNVSTLNWCRTQKIEFRNSMWNKMIFCVVWSLHQIILPTLMMCFKGANACEPNQSTTSMFKIDHLKLIIIIVSTRTLMKLWKFFSTLFNTHYE